MTIDELILEFYKQIFKKRIRLEMISAKSKPEQQVKFDSYR